MSTATRLPLFGAVISVGVPDAQAKTLGLEIRRFGRQILQPVRR